MSDSTPAAPSTTPRRARWWYSADEKRGFAWASVVGYDYRQGGSAGFVSSVLYVYLSGGIAILNGKEADTVHPELVKLPKR